MNCYDGINTEDKDIVLFFGGTQVGKSTTINSLLGVKFELDEECYEKFGVINIKPIKDSKLIAEVPEIDKSGTSCTIVPSMYRLNDSNLYFIDTRGFNDTDGEKTNNFYATLLLQQLVVNNPKSIRLVLLHNSNELEGLNKFQSVVDLLECINFKDKNVAEKIKVYLLLNRYQLTPMDIKKIQKDKMSKQDCIMSAMKKRIDKLEENVDKNIKEYENGGDIDAEKMLSKKIIIEFIKKCKIGYIDPTDEDSVECVLNDIKDESLIVPNNSIKFFDRQKNAFKKELVDLLEEIYIPLIKMCKDFQYLDIDVLKEIKKEFNERPKKSEDEKINEINEIKEIIEEQQYKILKRKNKIKEIKEMPEEKEECDLIEEKINLFTTSKKETVSLYFFSSYGAPVIDYGIKLGKNTEMIEGDKTFV